MRFVYALPAIACLAAPALAHDFWLQPQRFWIDAGATIPVAILVGHGANRAPWGVASDRVVALRSYGLAGSVDHLPALRERRVAEIPAMRFPTTGTHIVAVRSTHATSELPGLRFTEYLQEEGLTPALTLRARAGATGSAGREIYSRRAKALVQVGPVGDDQPHVTRPLGLTLEIVPERNPYAASAATILPVRIFYQGRALPGALVKLTNLQADEKPVATRISDRAGRAVFDVPRRGLWQLNVIWTKPIRGDARSDFDTTFSSLTFGYPATGG